MPMLPVPSSLPSDMELLPPGGWGTPINCSTWGVPSHGGTLKWMVYKGNPIQMDDLGYPYFSKPPFMVNDDERCWLMDELNWFKGEKIREHHHFVLWENLWFPVKIFFPLSQAIDG